MTTAVTIEESLIRQAALLYRMGGLLLKMAGECPPIKLLEGEIEHMQAFADEFKHGLDAARADLCLPENEIADLEGAVADVEAMLARVRQDLARALIFSAEMAMPEQGGLN